MSALGNLSLRGNLLQGIHPLSLSVQSVLLKIVLVPATRARAPMIIYCRVV